LLATHIQAGGAQKEMRSKKKSKKDFLIEFLIQ